MATNKYKISILKSEFLQLASNAKDESKTCKNLPPGWLSIFQAAINEYYSNTSSNEVRYQTVEISGNRSRLYFHKK